METGNNLIEWLQTRLDGSPEAENIILDLVTVFGGQNCYIPTMRTLKQKALEIEAKVAFERGASIREVVETLKIPYQTAWRYYRASRKAA